MFDCAIIGTGAAGVSAALTLKLLNRSLIWFGPKDLSFKIRAAEKINNYPGLAQTSGAELGNAFLEQTRQAGLEITEKRVTGVYLTDGYYTVLCDRERFEAKTVILATGVETVKPVKGELDFVGRGVSYCATCDGFLYRGKTIAVVSTGKAFEHEVEYLASLAEKAYVFPIYKNAELHAPNIERKAGMPLEIRGANRVETLVLKGEELPVDGVFFLKDAVSPAVLVGGLGVAEGHIVVDRACATNLKGCFAAGDCTGRPYQYAKAVGEGNVAAHSVNAYLSEKR